MNLPHTDTGDMRTVHVPITRIDAACAIEFKNELRGLPRPVPKRLILDLSQVEFIDSSGLGAIVACMKHLEDGARMDLAGLQPAVDKVFRLTRMDSIFKIYRTVDAAVAESIA